MFLTGQADFRKDVEARRAEFGRSYSIRPDGTIVLPVGEREPDRSIDELNRITRARLAAFCRLERVG